MNKKAIITMAVTASITMAGFSGITKAEAASNSCNAVQNQVVKKKICSPVISKLCPNQSGNNGNINQNPNMEDSVIDTIPSPEQSVPEVSVPDTDTSISEGEGNNGTTNETVSEISAFEQQVIDLTNAERAKSGLEPLTLDKELSAVARKKSEDMQANSYFSHTSPTYGSPFDMMKQFGISYSAAAENIAQGQTTPEEVVNAWMNSEGHRANIMNTSYTHIGVGYVANGNYWTQMFISK
ncbi:MAG: CAP domain-containing protein [Bacillus sp. (in: firmicutes)]